MLFAASTTAVLGSTAIVTGGAIAALPLYALIMVSYFNDNFYKIDGVI